MKSLFNYRKLLVLFLFLIILPFVSSCDNDGKAQETQIDFDNSLSGSFVESNVDSNEDGENAVLAILAGNLGSLGKVTFQSLLELTPLDPEAIIVPCTTPNGGPGAEVGLVESDTVFRVENTGQLIFAQGTAGTVCLPIGELDNSFSYTAEYLFIGGTGIYENATGSSEINGTGFILVGMAQFGGVTGTQTGEIVLE